MELDAALYELDAALYELKHIPVTVCNPYGRPGTFKIKLCEQPGSLKFPSEKQKEK